MTATNYVNSAWEIMRDYHLCDNKTRNDFEFNVQIGATIRGDHSTEDVQIEINFEGDTWFDLEYHDGKPVILRTYGTPNCDDVWEEISRINF